MPIKERRPFHHVPTDSLTEFLKQGAQKLLRQALEAEVELELERLSTRRTDQGLAGVVRSGYQPERQIQTGIGPVTVKVPKIRARDGKPISFRSALVPPFVRKTRSLETAIPWLYLKGVSSGEMQDALKVLVGPDAEGLSASTVSRLKQCWAEEYKQWREKPLHKDQWIYVWADGIHSGLRADDAWSSWASMNAEKSIFWRLRMVSESRLKVGKKCC